MRQLIRLLRASRARSRRLDGFWRIGGRLFHLVRRRLGIQPTSTQSVGPYGPFRFSGDFALADFAGWGQDHNNGFAACVEASRGKRCVIDAGAHRPATVRAAHVVAPEASSAIELALVSRMYLEQNIELNGL